MSVHNKTNKPYQLHCWITPYHWEAIRTEVYENKVTKVDIIREMLEQRYGTGPSHDVVADNKQDNKKRPPKLRHEGVKYD